MRPRRPVRNRQSDAVAKDREAPCYSTTLHFPTSCWPIDRSGKDTAMSFHPISSRPLVHSTKRHESLSRPSTKATSHIACRCTNHRLTRSPTRSSLALFPHLELTLICFHVRMSGPISRSGRRRGGFRLLRLPRYLCALYLPNARSKCSNYVQAPCTHLDFLFYSILFMHLASYFCHVRSFSWWQPLMIFRI